MFEFDLLSLRESKSTSEVGKGLLRKHDRAGSDGANAAGKLNVFDCFREALQPAAVLLEKSQARPVDLAVNQQPNQTLVAEDRGERKLPLRTIEGRGCFAERLVMNAGHFLVRRVAHGRVIAVKIQRAHCRKMISRARRTREQRRLLCAALRILTVLCGKCLLNLR